MTDELEPRLQADLARRAAAARPVPDLADLDRRISARQRGRTRALGAALALTVALGPLAGFAVGQAGGDDDGVSALGEGAPAAGEGDGASSGPPYGEAGTGLDYGGAPLALVSDRTTAQGIRLVVRRGMIDQAPVEGDCVPDGTIRVGVRAGDLVGSVLTATYPPAEVTGGRVGVTGIAEDRPVIVGIVRADEGSVVARFPDGSTDEADVVDGVAVVAAFAEPGADPGALLSSQIELVERPERTPATIDGRRPYPECTASPDPSGPVGVPEMPAPGEQPADPAAEDEVRALYVAAFDSTSNDQSKAELHERPDVWLAANAEFRTMTEYLDIAETVHAEVDAVVFTAPDRATVRFQLLSEDPRNTAPQHQLGEAVLLDGRWVVSIDTACGLLALAGVECQLGP